MSRRVHNIDQNEFCYICAKFIIGPKRNFNESLREAYWNYFKTSCSDIAKPFTPSFICSTCQRNLYRYKKNNDVKLPFQCAAIWTEYTTHEYGICYFCTIQKPYFKREAKYFDCGNCILPKGDIPDLADRVDHHSAAFDDETCESDNVTECDDKVSDNEDFKWSMDSFNDFCRELNLSKLLSRKCLTMLKKDHDIQKKLTSVTIRKVNERSKDIAAFFSNSGNFVYCANIQGLMTYLGVAYKSSDWCLFMDSSIASLKGALMYRNSKLPSIPVAYANVKEDRSSVEKILELLDYHSHGWLIMCDLKVLNFIMGLKSGYAKYPCFYCMFDSRQSVLDFNPTHTWPVRLEFPNEPLAPVEKIALPVLHIKLGLFQKYVKTLEKESYCFQFICRNIKKSEAKLCNGVLTGPEIRYLMSLEDFPATMSDVEREAWFKLCDVARDVLGKHVTEDWKEKVDLLISALQAMGCRSVTNKMHLIFKHKDKFEGYLGNFSDEHGERLHKEMQVLEKRFGRNANKEMLAEYIWSVKRDTKCYKSSRTVFGNNM